MSEKQMQAIESLARNEELISRLYATFAEKIPEHRAFWEKMAGEETQHANMIRALAFEVHEGNVRFKEEIFDELSVGMFQDYVKAFLAQSRKKELSEEKAFEAALAIEHDLIERNFFILFETEEEELALIFEGVASSTREHRRRLVEELEASRKAKGRGPSPSS